MEGARIMQFSHSIPPNPNDPPHEQLKFWTKLYRETNFLQEWKANEFPPSLILVHEKLDDFPLEVAVRLSNVANRVGAAEFLRQLEVAFYGNEVTDWYSLGQKIKSREVSVLVNSLRLRSRVTAAISFLAGMVMALSGGAWASHLF